VWLDAEGVQKTGGGNAGHTRHEQAQKTPSRSARLRFTSTHLHRFCQHPASRVEKGGANVLKKHACANIFPTFKNACSWMCWSVTRHCQPTATSPASNLERTARDY
jgi:hypothetical protein